MKRKYKLEILKNMKRIFSSKALEFITVAMLPVCFIFFNVVIRDKPLTENYFNFSFATSVSITYLIALLFKWMLQKVARYLEDSDKLTIDYIALCNKYARQGKLIKFENSEKSSAWEMGLKYTDCTEYGEKKGNKKVPNKLYRFPVIELCRNAKSRRIEIQQDSKKLYQLPTLIEMNSTELMKSHKHSIIYNNLNIRLDDLREMDDKILLKTSRTTYFSSLLSNRAMDTKLSSGLTIRKMYEVGPSITELSESKLSNHLGFNGFVVTSDDHVIFVKRYNNVSIGKNTLGTSIGASLKTKHALDNNLKLTRKGLEDAILAELKDELCINLKESELDLDKCIISFYRDLVEGGKPQFLFYIKINEKFVDVEKHFMEDVNKDKDKKRRRDGNKLVSIKLQDLQDKDKMFLASDILVVNNRRYEMVPSSAASIVIFLDYLSNPIKNDIEFEGTRNVAKSILVSTV